MCMPYRDGRRQYHRSVLLLQYTWSHVGQRHLCLLIYILPHCYWLLSLPQKLSLQRICKKLLMYAQLSPLWWPVCVCCLLPSWVSVESGHLEVWLQLLPKLCHQRVLSALSPLFQVERQCLCLQHRLHLYRNPLCLPLWANLERRYLCLPSQQILTG